MKEALCTTSLLALVSLHLYLFALGIYIGNILWGNPNPMSKCSSVCSTTWSNSEMFFPDRYLACNIYDAYKDFGIEAWLNSESEVLNDE